MIGAAACALLLAAAVAGAAETSEPPAAATDRLQKVQERRQALEDEIARLRSDEKGLLSDVERLELEVRLREQELRESQLTLRRARDDMDAAQKRAAELEKSLAAARPAVIARSRTLYKLGKFSYLRLLLSVDRPVDVFRAYRFVSRLAREDKERVGRFRRDLDALQATRGELEKKSRQALELRTEAEKRRRRLDAERRRKTELLTSLVERKEMHLAYFDELQQAEGKLRQLVEGGADEDASIPIAAFRGSLPWPVAGAVRVPYGPRKHPRFETVTPHNGLEIEAPPESEVKAVHEGTVTHAGRFLGYGHIVVVDHGGKHHTIYARLADVKVALGQRVAGGDVVGTLSPEEPADLYFELCFQGRPVDPADWLARPDKK